MNSTALNSSFKTLEELNDNKARHRLPTVIFLSILIPLGIIGNSTILAVYSRKYRPSTFRTFILTLAVLDLLSCLIGMPFELVDNVYPLMFYSEELCKVGKFFGQILKIGSAFVIFLMAVCRFQKICRPFSPQMSIKMARNLCVASILVAVLFSWPFAIIRGKQHRKFDGGVIGYACSVDDEMKDTNYPFIYAIVIFIINVLVFFGLIILYTLIILTVHRHNHNKIIEAQQKIEPRITKIMIAITIAFMVSYLPDNILDANSTFNEDNLLPNTPAVLGSLPLIARTYFINNIINPIIYFVGDSKFRKTIKSVWQAMFYTLFRRDEKTGRPVFIVSDTFKTEDQSPNTKCDSAANSDIQL
jgi:hypothetical protein